MASGKHWNPRVCFQMSRVLLERRCDKHSLNRFGDTPLHVLTMKNRAECVLSLLTYSADANRVGRNGNSPLHMSIAVSVQPNWMRGNHGGFIITRRILYNDISMRCMVVMLFLTFQLGMCIWLRI